MNTSQKSVNLPYNYAQVEPDTGLCISCCTYSYEIPLHYYIPVPDATNDYIGKYYNFSDQLWYLTSDFSQIWADAPQW